jgi:hypothetical protein
MTTMAGDVLSMRQLKLRGWTTAMVRDLLGEPDKRRPNPFFRSGAPMGLWLAARVAAAEADPAFGERKAKAGQRSAASSGVAARKRADLVALAASVPVEVPRLPRDALVRRACASYNAWHEGGLGHEPATPASDPAFLARIMVNCLRHELSGYEVQLDALLGRVGRAAAGQVIRGRVYAAIGEAYPYLAAECARQLRDRTRIAT